MQPLVVLPVLKNDTSCEIQSQEIYIEIFDDSSMFSSLIILISFFFESFSSISFYNFGLILFNIFRNSTMERSLLKRGYGVMVVRLRAGALDMRKRNCAKYVTSYLLRVMSQLLRNKGLHRTFF